jgi:DNA-binding MarR family transcriptional regulator
MAQTVGELEADGLVKRRPDPDDGRRALVELTPAGRGTLEDDRRRRVGWLVSAIEELPARDQAVLARATAIIGRLAERSD